MCLQIDPTVKKLNKRVVWKVFDRGNTAGTGSSRLIVSLYRGASYPKGKLVERSKGPSTLDGAGLHGLHFFLSKAQAKIEAEFWGHTYIAKFKVNPKDFMFINGRRTEAMYERATRVGNYIKVERTVKLAEVGGWVAGGVACVTPSKATRPRI
jgi:hypothetical protein